MHKKYKFFSVDPAEIDLEHGNYPIQSLVPYGPEHTSESDAEEWLHEKAGVDKKYILIQVYSI